MEFDYVVVGAGSAGCVVANRLSADGETSVALIEAGPRGRSPWIHIPVGYFKTMGNPRSDWRFRTEPDPGINGRSINWPRGRVLGGSSSINGLLYVRGQKEDFDGWRQLGNVAEHVAQRQAHVFVADKLDGGAFVARGYRQSHLHDHRNLIHR